VGWGSLFGRARGTAIRPVVKTYLRLLGEHLALLRLQTGCGGWAAGNLKSVAKEKAPPTQVRDPLLLSRGRVEGATRVKRGPKETLGSEKSHPKEGGAEKGKGVNFRWKEERKGVRSY